MTPSKFNQLVYSVQEQLSLGDVDGARLTYEVARLEARTAEEIQRTHDVANEIQRDLFAAWEANHG